MTIGVITKLAKYAEDLVELLGDAGASVINYKSSLASAISRSLREKLEESVSIRDFGAIGDGVSDSVNALLAAGSSTTGTVLIPPGNFIVNATVANSAQVLGMLSRVRIDGTLVVNLAAGAHSFTSPVRMFSGGLKVNALSIVGAAPASLSITNQVSVSGTAGNYTVVFGVSSIANAIVGDFLHTHTVDGTGVPEVHRGMWEIIAVDAVNSQITVKNTCRKSAFPTNTITSSASVVLKTVLHFNDCDGFVVTGSRIDFLNNVAIVGNSDAYWSSANITGTEKGTHGLTIGSMTIALNGKLDNANQYGVSPGHVSCGPNVGVNGFDQQGIVTELGGTFWGDFVSSCNNKRRGIYASTASGIRAKHISVNGNFLDGAIADIGGNIYASSVSCAVGNGARGVTASQGSTVVFDTGIMSYNISDGMGAVLGGCVQATTCRAEFNEGSGSYADYGGVLVINNSNLINNTRYGIDAGGGATVRALTCVMSTNLLHGARATELAVIILTGSTFTGNVVGDKTVRGDGSILDTSGYTVTTRVGTEFRAIPTASNQGVRIAATSAGDDFIIGHDTVGSGTFTSSFHARSGNSGFYPHTDNTVILGRASERWSTVYAGTGTINTSDGREKTPVLPLVPAELAAAAELSKAIGVYKWLKAVEEKGDNARCHIGMTVQQAIAIMESHGLEPMAYGFICYDSWEARPEEVVQQEDGSVIVVHPAMPAGDRYSFRMDELNMFIAAGLEARLTRLENTPT